VKMRSGTVGRALGALLFVGVVLLFTDRLARDGVPVYHQVGVAKASLRVTPDESIVQQFTVTSPPLTSMTLSFMHPSGRPIRGYEETVHSPGGYLISEGSITPSQIETGAATWPVLQFPGSHQGTYSLAIAMTPQHQAGRSATGSAQPIDIAYGVEGASEKERLMVGGKPHPGTLALTIHFNVGLPIYLLHLPSLFLNQQHALPVGLPLNSGPTEARSATVVAGILTLLGLVVLISLGMLCAIRLGDSPGPSSSA
jgi:hypothetical protein